VIERKVVQPTISLRGAATISELTSNTAQTNRDEKGVRKKGETNHVSMRRHHHFQVLERKVETTIFKC
jgi:hypothetical protein